MTLVTSLLLLGCELLAFKTESPRSSTEALASDVEEKTQRAGTVRIVHVPTGALALSDSEGCEQELSEEVMAKAMGQHAVFVAQMKRTRAQLRAHNRRVLSVILIFMVMFVVFLSAVGFFLGRRAVEQGLQSALRGPQLRVKQAELAIRQAKQDAKDSAHNAGLAGIRAVVVGAHGVARGSKAAASATSAVTKSVSRAVRSHDWGPMRRASLGVAKGVIGAPGHALRRARRKREPEDIASR